MRHLVILFLSLLLGPFSFGQPTFMVDLGPDTTVCRNSAVTLHPQISGGVPPYRYSWSPATAFDTTFLNSPAPIALVGDTTLITVLVTDGLNQTATDSIYLYVYPFPSFSLLPPDTVCLGDSSFIGVSGSSPPGLSYSWEPGWKLGCDQCPQTWCAPTNTTTYILTATDSMGCMLKDSVEVSVYTPDSIFVPSSISVCEGDSVALNASGGVSYAWQPNSSLSCTLCPDPVGISYLHNRLHRSNHRSKRVRNSDYRVCSGITQTFLFHFQAPEKFASGMYLIPFPPRSLLAGWHFPGIQPLVSAAIPAGTPTSPAGSQLIIT